MALQSTLYGLQELFPQMDIATLIDVATAFGDDIDSAVDFVIFNFYPNIRSNTCSLDEPSNRWNDANIEEDLSISGQKQVEEPNTDSGLDLVAHLQAGIEGLPEPNGGVTSFSNQRRGMPSFDHLIGEYCDEQQQCSSSETKLGILASEDHSTLLHVDSSPDMTICSSYSVSLDFLDNAIADEKNKKSTLLSSVVSVSDILEKVEFQEATAKQARSEASQAGHDILVKVAELKEMLNHAREENDKFAGEVFAEKSILATEAHELQTRLHKISEESSDLLSIIAEMCRTLRTRLGAAVMEILEAEKEKFAMETVAREALKEQEFLLNAAKEESKVLEEQAQENAKLRELLMDRGRAVDTLHGEILGIFDDIIFLKQQVVDRVPADEALQLDSSSLSSSVDSSLSESSISSAPTVAGSCASLNTQKLGASHMAEKKISDVPDVPGVHSSVDADGATHVTEETITDVPDGHSTLDLGGWDFVEAEDAVVPMV